MVKNSGFIFFVFVLFISSFELLCQNSYPVKGTVFVREGKASQVNLCIKTHDEQRKIPVDLNGDFITYLEWDKDYQFNFSKKGYVSKCINFSTKTPHTVDKSSIYPYEILVELFPIFPGVDTVFFKSPVAKIHFNNSYNDFNYDTDYQLSIKYKLEKVKNDYLKWSNKIKSSIQLKKEEVTKKQELTALHYQKTVEIETKEKVPSPTSKTTRQTEVKNNDNPFNLPPLKVNYPQGKSVEIHLLKGKQITRVIMKNGEYQKVFYKVKHNWGGLYFFVQEAPNHYRSISKYNFDKSTNL